MSQTQKPSALDLAAGAQIHLRRALDLAVLTAEHAEVPPELAHFFSQNATQIHAALELLRDLRVQLVRATLRDEPPARPALALMPGGQP